MEGKPFKITTAADFVKAEYMEQCPCNEKKAYYYCSKNPPCNGKVLYCDACSINKIHDHENDYISIKCEKSAKDMDESFTKAKELYKQISLKYDKIKFLIEYCADIDEKQKPQKKAQLNIKKDYERFSKISLDIFPQQKKIIETAIVGYKVIELVQLEKDFNKTLEEVNKLAYLTDLSCDFVLENYQSSVINDQNGSISKFTVEELQKYLLFKFNNIPGSNTAEGSQDFQKLVQDIVGKITLLFCKKIQNQNAQSSTNFEKIQKEKADQQKLIEQQIAQNVAKDKQQEQRIAQLKAHVDSLKKIAIEKSEENAKLVKKFEDDMTSKINGHVSDMKKYVEDHNGCAH